MAWLRGFRLRPGPESGRPLAEAPIAPAHPDQTADPRRHHRPVRPPGRKPKHLTGKIWSAPGRCWAPSFVRQPSKIPYRFRGFIRKRKTIIPETLTSGRTAAEG